MENNIPKAVGQDFLPIYITISFVSHLVLQLGLFELIDAIIKVLIAQLVNGNHYEHFDSFMLLQPLLIIMLHR